MFYDTDTVGIAGLRFFGKMSASISHEIKNVLAIINENAGLLKDYTLMAEKGLDLNPHQVCAKAEKIMAQVARADEIMKKMNVLAHSIDEDRQQTNLDVIIKLMIALSDRMAAMKNIKLELSATSESVSIITAPFFLENLISLCLDFILNMADEGSVLQLGCEKTKKGALIRFTQPGKLPDEQSAGFSDDTVTAMMAALQAELFMDPALGEIIITLPKEI
ncbi:hypothetical protein QUF75_09065 [Desulfococcaceae bacterium HSG7]|nr:hypothetical protein [Desulfococcaceae bacterium HSG7]